MGKLVTDCSVSAGWYLPDEKSPEDVTLLRRILEGHDSLFLPHLWWYENLNVLRSAVARGRITRDGARQAILALSKVPCELLPTTRERRVLICETAIETGISAYDATYIVTARECNARLVTADRQLLQLKAHFDFLCSVDEII